MSGFGAGLGTLIGSGLANDQLNAGSNTVNNISSSFANTTAPYNSFGQSFLPQATNAIGGVQQAAGQTQGYNQFMQGYTNTPAAQ